MARRILRVLFAIIFVASLAGRSEAQSPAQRQVVDSLRRAFGVLDPGILRAVLDTSVRGRSDALTRLERGWLLLNLGQRDTSDELLLRAADEFYEVTVRRPHWVYGWFGLGSAKMQLAELGAREVGSAHQAAGTGWRFGAQTAFRRATQEDPTYAPATAALAQVALRTERAPTDPEILAAIDHALAQDSTDPIIWTLLGRSKRRQRDHADALAAFERALALHPVDSGAVLLEVARELFASGEAALATKAYYQGARTADSAGVALYRHDLGYIADSSELAEFDSLRAEQRSAWLATFWTRRERASGRPAGSRLVEHYRRWAYCLEHFRRSTTWARQSDFAMIYRSPDIELDDRGAVYMRHGEPDATTGYIGGPNTPFNASWLYFRPERNLVFHFVLGRGVSGWRLAESFRGIGGNDPEAWASRIGFGHEYGRIAFDLEAALAKARAKARIEGSTREVETVIPPEGGTLGAAIERERQASRRSIQVGMTTDSDPIRFKREMEPLVQVFGAGTTQPKLGRLVVALSLPANDRLVAESLPAGGVGYSLRLRVTSADDSGRTTLDVDTLVRVRLPRALERREYLSFVRTFDLPATGEQRVRVILTDTARAYGAVRVVNDVPLPPLPTDRVEMSDLIIGSWRSGVVWRPPEGGEVPLQPLNAWPRTDALEIAFDLGGLRPSQGYRVRLGISDIGADSTTPPKASVEFERSASASRELVTQSLGLHTLRPGRYLLSVTVTVGDRVLQRSRRITIVAPE